MRCCVIVIRCAVIPPAFWDVLQCKCIDPKNLGEPACELPEYKGDGNCDDENNVKGCAYDGGDCCYKTVEGGKVNKKYCSEVGAKHCGVVRRRNFEMLSLQSKY